MSETLNIRVDAIVASKTNPRKHFDQEALQELAESIRKHGVLQPILVRQTPGDALASEDFIPYEIVAGERRWRAAQLAQLERIPATVRSLTDAEVLEIQVVENLQRADLHPLEEAEGYEALMKCQHFDGRAYTAEEIAAKVGKSKSYVYQRLKLTALTEKAREAFYGGQLDASRALLVARIPAHMQELALARILPDPGQDWRGPLSFRQARDMLHREFMLTLKDAPFDTKMIYFGPDGKASPIGPSCAECPKRTGNQPELFGDVDSADVCTDPGCFHAKTDAQGEVMANGLRTKGHEVLTGKEARKVLPSSRSQTKGGLVRLDHILNGDPSFKELKHTLKREKVKLPVTYVQKHDRPTEFAACVNEAAAREQLVAAGCKWAGKEKPAKGQAKPEARPDARDRELESAIAVAVHKALREAVREKGLDETALRALISSLDAWVSPALVGAIGGPWKDPREYDEPAADELQPMLIDIAFPDDDFHEHREALARHYGVDVDSIDWQVRQERNAAGEQEKPAKKAKKREGVTARTGTTLGRRSSAAGCPTTPSGRAPSTATSCA